MLEQFEILSPSNIRQYFHITCCRDELRGLQQTRHKECGPWYHVPPHSPHQRKEEKNWDIKPTSVKVPSEINKWYSTENLPSTSNHMLWKRSQHSLHHCKMLEAFMSLEESFPLRRDPTCDQFLVTLQVQIPHRHPTEAIPSRVQQVCNQRSTNHKDNSTLDL